MYKKQSILSGSVVYLLLIVLLLLSGCAEFSSSSGYRPGATDYPSNKLQFPSNANDSIVDQGKSENKDVETASESEKQIEVDKVSRQVVVPPAIAVNVGGGGNKPVSFLDRYEEQLRRLDANKSEIEGLKKMVKNGELQTNDLQTRLDVAIEEVELANGKVKELEALNEKMTIEFSEQLKKDGEMGVLYKKQVKELKLKLVKSQIDATKTKQELVRIKTQYLMDKKKWEEKER